MRLSVNEPHLDPEGAPDRAGGPRVEVPNPSPEIFIPGAPWERPLGLSGGVSALPLTDGEAKGKAL